MTTNNTTNATSEHEEVGDFITVLTTKSRVLTKRVSQGVNGHLVLRDYDNVKRFARFETISVTGLADLAEVFNRISPNTAAVIGKTTDAAVMGARRLMYDDPKTGERATLIATAHYWVPIDLDSVPCPEGLDPIADPEAAVTHTVHQYLPAEMYDCDVLWQFTSSAGIKPGIRLRLVF
jgi:hypothetical protein